ncbi:MAG: tetratricopeptide repeat protein [Candidatus Aphodosoma sp.]
MKRFLLINVLFLAFLVTGFAQKANVNGAKNKALSVDNPDYNAAKDMIQAALANDETKDLTNTWYVAGLVYEKAADAEFLKVQTGIGSDEVMGEDALKAVAYYTKAYEMDLRPDAKGKVKPKFTNKIKASMLNIYRKMMLVNYGVKKFENKEWESAIKGFETHVNIVDMPLFENDKNAPVKDSTYYDIKMYAAQSAWAGDMNQQAIRMYNDLKAFGHKGNTVLQVLCQLYQAEKDTASYIATLQEGVEKYPQEFYYLGNLINYYVYGGEPEKATEYLNKAIEKDPGNPQLYNVKGSMLELKEDYEGAMENFDRALSINPQMADAWVNKGRLIYNKAFKAEGEANSIRDFKQLDAAMEEVNKIYKEAIPFFEKAIEINADDIEAMKILRGLYYRFSDDDPSYQQKYNDIVKRING